MERMEGEAADLLDPVRWLSPESDGHARERELLASLVHVTPSVEARRAVWEGIDAAARKRMFVDPRARRRPPRSSWPSWFAVQPH
jgi:hypothetical protein